INRSATTATGARGGVGNKATKTIRRTAASGTTRKDSDKGGKKDDRQNNNKPPRHLSSTFSYYYDGDEADEDHEYSLIFRKVLALQGGLLSASKDPAQHQKENATLILL
ncbi:unnamed protein product, partial [Amoebophrya sp. A120]